MDKNTTIGNGKIRSLFDAASFVEIGAYVKSSVNGEEYDSVICGYGSVGGKLVFAFAQDMERSKGALDASGAKKIQMLYDMAIKNGAPVIGMFDSAGAVVYEGSAAMAAYGTWMKCVADASGIVPQIALVSGVCAGSAAVVASMFDVVLGVGANAQLYLTAPAVLGADTATADAAAQDGLVSAVYDDESAAIAGARALIELLPQNNCDSARQDAAQIGTVAADAVLPAGILDGQAFVELYAAYGQDVITGLGRMGGDTVGVVYAKDTLTAEGARKAARMVRFCDCFHLPVITLVDCDGLAAQGMQGAQPEATAYARLASAYATARCPKVTVIVGRAYGAAYTLLGSKALGADLVFALPCAVISAMAPDRAVAFVWNDKVTEENSREAVEQEWIDTYAKPELAAANGDVDDIIAPEELRMRVCSAVYMLATKAESCPCRRHAVLPL